MIPPPHPATDGHVPAKAKSPAASDRRFYALVGSDEGMVREKALHLYQQLTGGVDDGFTHETIDGIAGIEGQYSSKGSGERGAWFRDSEGNMLGIGEPVP